MNARGFRGSNRAVAMACGIMSARAEQHNCFARFRVGTSESAVRQTAERCQATGISVRPKPQRPRGMTDEFSESLKQATADANQSRAFFDGNGKVTAHAHRQLGQGHGGILSVAAF